MLHATSREKEVILDDLDVAVSLGQWRPGTKISQVKPQDAPKLIYERSSLSSATCPLQKVTAVAIVRNESEVIYRMLQSTLPWVQGCVILDTGSTDKTIDLIKTFMETHDWYGKIYEWPSNAKTFQFNKFRTAAVKLAHSYGQWLLLTDADYVWECSKPTFLDQAHESKLDVIRVCTSNGNAHFRAHLVRSHIDFEYERRTHEFTNWTRSGSLRFGDTSSLKLHDKGDGGFKTDKLLRDLGLLKLDLKEYGEDKDARSWFYMGCTLQSLNRIEQAMEAFTKRIHIGGQHWPQEVFLSMNRRANMMAVNLKYPTPVWLQEALEAFIYSPQRLESLYFIVERLAGMKEYELASSIGTLAYHNQKQVSHHYLFVSDNIHDNSYWAMLTHCLFEVREHNAEYLTAGFQALRKKISQGLVKEQDALLMKYLDYFKKQPTAHAQFVQSILSYQVQHYPLSDLVDFHQGKPAKPRVQPTDDAKQKALAERIKTLLRQAVDLRKEQEANSGSFSLKWIACILDAIKLAVGLPIIGQVLKSVQDTMRHSNMDNLTGVFFRIAFP